MTPEREILLFFGVSELVNVVIKNVANLVAKASTEPSKCIKISLKYDPLVKQSAICLFVCIIYTVCYSLHPVVAIFHSASN